MSNKRVTVIVATHNRMDIVHQLLFSLRMQTFKNFDLCIVDDSDDVAFTQEKWTKHSLYSKIIGELQMQGHRIRILPGPKTYHVGAVYQVGWEGTRDWGNPLVNRAEDDSWLSPDYLEKVVPLFDDPLVGAASGLMLFAGTKPSTFTLDDERYKHGTIEHLNDGVNVQWSLHTRKKPFPVEHINSAMMLTEAALERINGFEPTLLNFHREDTHLSWRVHLEGMKVLIHPGAIAYHFRAGTGGARAVKDGSKSLDDLRRWNILKKNMKPGIHISLTHAIGDLVMAEPAFRQLREMYPERNISVFHPYGEHVFKGNPDIDEIAKGQFDAQRTYRLEKSIYSFMSDTKHEGHMVNAYCKMLGVPEVVDTTPRLYDIAPMVASKKYVVLTPQSNAKLFDFSDISRTKYWAVERWQEVIDFIKETYDYDVIHLTGDEVHDEFEGVVRIRNLPFREAWSWIAGAELLLSIDTMAAHVAAALNIPSIVLWGRTDPETYGYEKDNILNFAGKCPESHNCHGGIKWQQDKTQCPLEDHPCMYAHTVDMIKEATKSLLGEVHHVD